MNKVHIVAGTYEQAKLAAQRNDLLPNEFSYVSHPEQLRGLDKNTKVWYTGTYYMNRMTPAITDVCRICGIPIIFKEY